MSDPFAFLPMAIAAGHGRVDDFEAQQLIAAGFTLLQRSASLVRALSGRRGAILLPTSPAFFTALAACDGRGAVLINPLAAPSEVAHQLRDANVGAVFTTSSLARLLPQGTPTAILDDAPRAARVIVDGIAREVDLGSHVGMTIEGESDTQGSDDEAVVVYTSAMAGTPLGAILSHRNLLSNARATIAATGTSESDRVLALLPFAHLFGLTVTGIAPLLASSNITTMARFSPSSVVTMLTAGEVTELVGVPSVFRALLSALSKGNARVSDALRLCVCGGAPLSTDLQARWFDATGVELRQGYGLTEAGPVCLFNSVDRPNARGKLGTPFPGVDVDLKAPVPYGETGVPAQSENAHSETLEICVRGANVFQGYVSGSERGLVIRDGWLHTGDLGQSDKNGAIEFAGLVKPMFTRNGFNIYPHEIERVVLTMPGVRSATVRELLKPEADEEPEIALEVAGSVSETDVAAWCADRLSGYKRPTRIVIRE